MTGPGQFVKSLSLSIYRVRALRLGSIIPVPVVCSSGQWPHTHGSPVWACCGWASESKFRPSSHLRRRPRPLLADECRRRDGGPVSLPEVPRAGAGWLGNVTYIPTPSPTNCNLALNAWTGQSVRPRAGSWKTKKDLGPSISFVLDNTAAGADWTGCAATMFQADSGRPEWPASCRRRSPPSACCIKSAP